jgi:hypothetical protein
VNDSDTHFPGQDKHNDGFNMSQLKDRIARQANNIFPHFHETDTCCWDVATAQAVLRLLERVERLEELQK